MFHRTLSPKFPNTVTVTVLDDQGNEVVNTFTGIFKRATAEELKALRKISDEELARDRLAGWELVDGDTRENLPFTPENLDSVLSIAPSARGIAVAFWEGVNGARAKNS
ncbi:hypothetical protein [Variovorax sp. HJSM1_2]|uniref:hypothetical protein n=1 Tax=Variovorax sp. HJSM1_2 TaxID=3366263 RepID=UPI003BBFB8F3